MFTWEHILQASVTMQFEPLSGGEYHLQKFKWKGVSSSERALFSNLLTRFFNHIIFRRLDLESVKN